VTRTALRTIVAVVLGLLASAAAGQDYAREKRWESEVTGNLVVGDPVKLPLRSGHAFLGLYTPVANARTGVVLVHGIGVHPDHGVIGILRTALSDRGYTTLSIQMPVQASDAGPEAYTPAVFDEAVERISVAGRWLRARGPANLVLLSHSMGSRMSRAYWEKTKDAPYAAWICLGMSAELSGLRGQRAPILDVYGEFDLPAVRSGAPARAQAIEPIAGSRQMQITGADHFYSGREAQLADVIVAFLQARETGGAAR
jgi:alpha/beta superfamily hydrolase